MPTTDELQFEMQRRLVLFNSGTTMPDNISTLGYEGNPNLANTSTPGQALIYNSPQGTQYIQRLNGNLWYKASLPNNWLNFSAGGATGAVGATGSTGATGAMGATGTAFK